MTLCSRAPVRPSARSFSPPATGDGYCREQTAHATPAADRTSSRTTGDVAVAVSSTPRENPRARYHGTDYRQQRQQRRPRGSRSAILLGAVVRGSVRVIVPLIATRGNRYAVIVPLSSYFRVSHGGGEGSSLPDDTHVRPSLLAAFTCVPVPRDSSRVSVAAFVLGRARVHE